MPGPQTPADAPAVRRPRLRLAVSVVALLVGAAGCQLRLETPPGDGPLRYRDEVFDSVVRTEDITYGSAKDLDDVQRSLELDLYEPEGDTATARPAIVWVHGGSFRTGSKRSSELVDQANHFSKLGYVNVSIEYRLSDGCAPFTDQCIAGIEMAYHDAQAAVRFLRRYASTYRIDVDRIAVGGSSAGGITAYNVAYGSENVGTSGNPGHSSKVRAAVSLSGAALTTGPAKGDPPTLDFHGTADTLVPLSWAESTIADARALGLRAEITIWEGDGHTPYAARRDEILTQTRNFLYHSMDLARAAR